jgi:hypothetical protein
MITFMWDLDSQYQLTTTFNRDWLQLFLCITSMPPCAERTCMPGG